MIGEPMLTRVQSVICFIATLVIILSISYGSGYKRGAAKIQRLWDKDKLVRMGELIKIQDKTRENEQINNQETTRISNELAQSKAKLDDALNRLATEHSKRMLASKDRASVYKRLAQGSPAERSDLASHAAQLDSSLEEGRALVKELADTLGLREDQLRLLGKQILADRKLMDGTNGSRADNDHEITAPKE